MKASELRIGNYITKGLATIYRVEGVVHDVVFTEGYQIPASEFSGIPLSEEWFIKFSAERRGDKGEYFYFNDCCIFEYLSQGTGFQVFDDNGIKIVFLQYVHELQNFYYAYKKEELE